ncbi:MAG TPA: DUF5666 domain-containing protein [Candidatus Eisenbacteria bacterium]|nr:DUF5666 domain-containing protein [Candidatus Eisenbacteria bacterium]
MNDRRARIILGLATILALAVPSAGRTQSTRAAAPDPLATFKAGQWVKVVGTPQGASPTPCSELKLLTGDFLDDDWSIQGTVNAVHADRREFTIGDCRITVSDKTIYESPEESIKGFTSLRAGSYVDVEGTFLSSHTLMAAEVDDESDEAARQPKLRTRVEMVGKVERVDTRRRVVSVMGMEFQVTPKTQVRSVLH